MLDKFMFGIALIFSYSQYGYEAGEIGRIIYLLFSSFHNGCMQISSISIIVKILF
jgi:hypothetical protein